MSKQFRPEIKIHDVITSRGRQMTEADVRLLIACSGADHPLHTDPIFCKEKMHFDQPILQGAMMLGVVDGFFNDCIFTGDEVVLAYGYEKIRFIRTGLINDVVHAEFELADRTMKGENELLTFNATVYNQNGEAIFFAVEKFCVMNEM